MKVNSTLLAVLCLVLMAAPAVAQDDNAQKRAINAYVSQVTSLKGRVEASFWDLNRTISVVQSLGEKLERTFMTAQRVLWPNDIEAAFNEVEPILAEFIRLDKEMQSLVRSARGSEAANKAARDLLAAVEAFDKRYDGGKKLVAAGKEARDWKDRIVNEMRLPRERDLYLHERDKVDEISKSTEKIAKVIMDLKKSAQQLVTATEP